MSRITHSFAMAAAAFVALSARAQNGPEFSWGLQLETDVGQMTSNTVQRPDNSSADRFEAVDYTGKTSTFGRLSVWRTVDWWRPGATLRFEIVPLQQSGTAIAQTAIRFDGVQFQAGSPLTVLYQFNTYRVTFDVPIFRNSSPESWEFRAGATLAIRDAQIRLKQPGQYANFTNYGPVPLAYGSAVWRASKRFSLESDVEAFPAPGGGGLLDASIRLTGILGHNTSLFLGARYLTGGAEDNSIYNYIHQRGALAGIRIAW